jgi:tetratricopeptide (TPR) repeat protein/predicted Ser/Thr protein kinase
MIGKTISHYKILEKLGEGGMGVVYKAEDLQLHRAVALKFLPPHIADNPEEKARLIQEAQSASALSHPNVTTIHEICDCDNQLFMVMEYLEGKTLKKIIEEESLSVKKVLEIAIQVCEGLSFAHEKGIVHLDIKSENIMLTSRGQVKIMDFGLAKFREAGVTAESGSPFGTAAYMSPEQASGEEIDHRSDIFSFGVVLYELLTKKLPFKGEHTAAIIYSILNEEPEPIRNLNDKVSSELERIILKTLAKDKEERYQHIDDLLADLRHEKKNLDYVKSDRIPREALPVKSKRKLLPFIVPTSIVTVLVLLLLIFKPFRFELSSEKRALAEENSLAIMYFENLKDKEDKDKIGEMVAELLIADLSESQYMKVVSSQRLYDIFKMMGKEGVKVIDKTVATDVAKKANTKYMLLGKIFSLEPELVITSQLVDVNTGNVIASQRIAGQNGKNLFSLVDSLSYEIKKDLQLPALAQKEEDKSVADITTHSPEALRLYLEGNELYNKLYSKEAAEKYEQAVKIDTTFASAYLFLALASSSLQDAVKTSQAIGKAFKFSDRVSRKEKLLINAIYQRFLGNAPEAKKILEEMIKLFPQEKLIYEYLGNIDLASQNYEEAIINFNKLIQFDSTQKMAYNSLAYAYDGLGRYDEAISAINKYIELAPNEANPYDSRGDIYAHHSEVDKAIESYNKALEVKPDFEASIQKLGYMYLYKREYSKAEQYFLKYGEVGTKSARSISRSDLALIPLSQGKLEAALRIWEQGISADELDKLKINQANKYFGMALIYLEKKEFEKAVQNGRKMVEIIKEALPQNLIYAKAEYGILLVFAGKLPEAEKIAREVAKEFENKSGTEKASWYSLQALIKYQHKDFDQAQKFSQLAKNEFSTRFWLATAYCERNMIGEAVQEFEKLSNWDILSKVIQPLFSSKIPYYLGICYEKSGWTNKAIKQYEEFLTIWKDADPGIKEVADAKERLGKLKKIS